MDRHGQNGREIGLTKVYVGAKFISRETMSVMDLFNSVILTKPVKNHKQHTVLPKKVHICHLCWSILRRKPCVFRVAISSGRARAISRNPSFVFFDISVCKSC